VVADYAAVPELGQVGCGRCDAAGRLVTAVTVEPGGGDRCPVCGGPLATAYVDTVN
jgi:hypothetical protein